MDIATNLMIVHKTLDNMWGSYYLYIFVKLGLKNPKCSDNF
jgi:hypothetical protein